MTYSAVLFDLDGTLLDSVDALSYSMNTILRKHGYPVHTTEAYKQFIGNGVHALVEQAVPQGTSKDICNQLYEEKSALYEQCWKQGTTLFPGIAELLTKLQQKHIPMGVFSNKEDHFTQQIVPHVLGQWTFVGVQGRTAQFPKKPDPSGLLSIIRKTQIAIPSWVHVGDKNADALVSQAVGCGFLWASWGYQQTAPEGAVCLGQPRDLLQYIAY
jgi:phosphoglycolate phosphatase